jgi:hypothetical protein
MKAAVDAYPQGMNVGIVGATDLVGDFMRASLADREFPVRSGAWRQWSRPPARLSSTIRPLGAWIPAFPSS